VAPHPFTASCFSVMVAVPSPEPSFEPTLDPDPAGLLALAPQPAPSAAARRPSDTVPIAPAFAT